MASGAVLTVDASSLASINSATVNGVAEKDRAFVFIGGAGADVFTGGSGADHFTGNGGADQQTGGNGVDVFIYKLASDSALVLSGTTIQTTGADTLQSFFALQDKIDLSAFGFGINGSIIERNVASYTGTAPGGNTFFGAGNEVVVEYGASSTTRVYVDVNGNGSLDSSDALIQLTGVSAGALSATNFKF